jgi:hypothetical protein
MDIQTQIDATKSELPAHRVIFEFADEDLAVSSDHPRPDEPEGVDSLRFRSWLSRSEGETGARAR